MTMGGNSGSKAAPQAPAGLSPSGYDPGRGQYHNRHHPGARKPSLDGALRNRTVTVHCTAEEVRKLDNIANKRGMTRSALVAMLVNAGVRYMRNGGDAS
jgi:hypothetical protein